MPTEPEMKCGECKGTGRLWMMPDGHEVECGDCDGSGEDQVGTLKETLRDLMELSAPWVGAPEAEYLNARRDKVMATAARLLDMQI